MIKKPANKRDVKKAARSIEQFLNETNLNERSDLRRVKKLTLSMQRGGTVSMSMNGNKNSRNYSIAYVPSLKKTVPITILMKYSGPLELYVRSSVDMAKAVGSSYEFVLDDGCGNLLYRKRSEPSDVVMSLRREMQRIQDMQNGNKTSC